MPYETREATVSELKELYDAFLVPYFPAAERKPYFAIRRMMQTGHYRFLTLADETGTVGIAAVTGCPETDLLLLDYLAVREDARSGGIGAKLLKVCRDFAGDRPMIIETEDIDLMETAAEKAQCARRNAFYARNGAVPTGVKTRMFGVPFCNSLLADGRPATDDEVRQAIAALYAFMIGNRLVYDKCVVIG
ncbi:MAG: GNAT family N-acetyltransferase [Clostridia bacterium]|nr:GNAT family N-acetyltransferase [Clostridia bacterium]